MNIQWHTLSQNLAMKVGTLSKSRDTLNLTDSSTQTWKSFIQAFQ